MTALTTESRTALTTAFSGLGYTVYNVVPPVPKPPCVVVIPDSPWVRPDRIGSALNYEVRWRVLAVISPRKNDATQLDTENAIDTLLHAIPAGYSVELVGAPQLTDVGAQGTVTTTEINVSVRMKE